MRKINLVFHGKELDEFGFPVDYHSIVAYYHRLENIGIVVTMVTVAGISINESFIVNPPDGVFEELWVELRIQDRLRRNSSFEGLSLEIFH